MTRYIKEKLRRFFYENFIKIHRNSLDFQIKNHYPDVHRLASIHYDVELVGNIQISNNTYINKGSTLSSGETSSVKIGKHCAIGRYVHITAKSHSFHLPTSDEQHDTHEHVEKDVIVGDYVWIGDHVFIKHGISIGDYAIIGANSVVTRDVKPFEIVAGVPAKHIRFNKEHYKYND